MKETDIHEWIILKGIDGKRRKFNDLESKNEKP